jgi:glyoxylase-like metal-dependent hydrolase (beta-lactamase superfamily II)
MPSTGLTPSRPPRQPAYSGSYMRRQRASWPRTAIPAGHTGYLFGEGDETVLFWGDIVHNHAVQLRLPYVSTAADMDEDAAVVARRSILQLISSNRWWVGAAHLPFPGLGHVRRDPDRYTWVPVTYAPVEDQR